jgi:hypothetical protein
LSFWILEGPAENDHQDAGGDQQQGDREAIAWARGAVVAIRVTRTESAVDVFDGAINDLKECLEETEHRTSNQYGQRNVCRNTLSLRFLSHLVRLAMDISVSKCSREDEFVFMQWP